MSEEEARLYDDIPVPVIPVPAKGEGGPGVLATLLKEEDDEEDKDNNDEKRRDEDDMQDSLVLDEGIIVKFLMVSFANCLLPLKLLLQGPFHQEEVKQPHLRDTRSPNIMNHLVPPEPSCHMPPCPFCQNSEIVVGRTSQERQPV